MYCPCLQPIQLHCHNRHGNSFTAPTVRRICPPEKHLSYHLTFTVVILRYLTFPISVAVYLHLYSTADIYATDGAFLSLCFTNVVLNKYNKRFISSNPVLVSDGNTETESHL